MDRLDALRAALPELALDGIFLSSSDAYLSEYVASGDKRLQWLSGFSGTVGLAAITATRAALLIDARYMTQAEQQLSAAWERYDTTRKPIAEWLSDELPSGGRIGFDPWAHSAAAITALRTGLEGKGITLVPLAAHPIDALWDNRPSTLAGPIEIYPQSLSGHAPGEKLARVAAWLREQGIDALPIAMLDSLAWTFDIRGTDLPTCPVPRGRAIVAANGIATLFLAGTVDPAVRCHLGDRVCVEPEDRFLPALSALRDQVIAIDPVRVPAAVADAVQTSGAAVRIGPDPLPEMRAPKTEAELAAHRAVQIDDGVALCRLLQWLDEQPAGTVSELDVARRLLDYRRASPRFRMPSFETIAASGDHAAIVHYRPTAETDRVLAPATLLLLDSGGQYWGGTTDITRTIAIGAPTDTFRHAYTTVLKAHIALARAHFPSVARGIQLDAIGRQHLWAAHLDFPHATGHGVGAYLGVHEGPQLVAQFNGANMGALEPLVPGMIVSNEPSVYVSGAFGIRLENLVAITRAEDGDSHWLGCETLSFAPFDRRLIDRTLLDDGECAWLDQYHAAVREKIGPHLEPEARTWLDIATAPLKESRSAERH